MEFSCINCALIIKERLEYIAQIVVFVKYIIINLFKSLKELSRNWIHQVESEPESLNSSWFPSLIVLATVSKPYFADQPFCVLPVPAGPPQNLQVFNATTTTLTVKWDHAPGPVQNYKITYQTLAGGKLLSVSSAVSIPPPLRCFEAGHGSFFQLWWWVAEHVLRKFKAPGANH